MSSDQPTYAMGATQLAIGITYTTGAIRITPPQYCNGWILKSLSGGSLAIVQGISNIASQGYLLGSGEAISAGGPAVFYLAAQGATAVAGCIFTYSQGYLGT